MKSIFEQKIPVILGKKPVWIIIYFILIFFVFINLFPFLNLFINAFREHELIIRAPLALDKFQISNFASAEKHAHLFRGLFNGVFISLMTIVLLIALGVANAYGLIFIKLKASPFIIAIISLGYFIPPASLLINAFLMLRNLRMLNTYMGIILVYTAIYAPITLIILSGFYKSVPASLIESAQIDGASHLRTCWQIVFPMSKSVLITLSVLLFLWTYRDFMWPLILMARPEKRTISVALSYFISDRQFNFGFLSAGVMISIIPIMALYIMLKENIMKGMAAGAIKG